MMNRRSIRTVIFTSIMVGASSVAGAQTPNVENLLTRAELTDYRETSRYEDVMAFVRRVTDASPRMHLATFGYTFEGRALPLVVVGDVDCLSP